MVTCARRFLRLFTDDEDGVTMIEYGLVATLIAFTAVTVMGAKLNDTFTSLVAKLT